jgi:hypothetical protein
MEKNFRTGITYVAESIDLAKILENEEGNFEVVHNGQVFNVTCREGHSIASFVPSGTKNYWLVTKREATLASESVEFDRERARTR